MLGGQFPEGGLEQQKAWEGEASGAPYKFGPSHHFPRVYTFNVWIISLLHTQKKHTSSVTQIYDQQIWGQRTYSDLQHGGQCKLPTFWSKNSQPFPNDSL